MIIYDDKINFFREVIDNVIVGITNYYNLNIVNSNEYNNCFTSIEKIINLINTINLDNHETILNELQFINNNISSIIKNYGIYNLDSMLSICLDTNYKKKYLCDNNKSKYEILKKYLHPINYKILNWNNSKKQSDNKINKSKNEEEIIVKNKIIDDKVFQEAPNLECFDLARVSNIFNIRIYGVKFIVHDYENKKTLVISAITDNIILNNINNQFIREKKQSLINYLKQNDLINSEDYIESCWNNYFNDLSIKEFLIYSNKEIYNKYISIMNNIRSIETKTLESIVNEFIGSELFTQRSMLICLLINNQKPEYLYIAYLLYDILSDEKYSNTDSNEQRILYNSLTWNCKKFFKTAMCKTIEYTNNLLNYDSSKIPIEQQICLMKAENKVKEKAMQKLKELKSKSEDSGSKARQYLDGLLKIPFGIYKEEFIMKKKQDILTNYNYLKNPIIQLNFNEYNFNNDLLIKDFFDMIICMINPGYSNIVEILNICNCFENNIDKINNYILNCTINYIKSLTKKKQISKIIKIINSKPDINKLQINDTIDINRNKIINIINNDLDFLKNNILFNIEKDINNHFFSHIINIEKYIITINKKNKDIVEYIKSFNTILDNAVYGHKNAKCQIERILGQWIAGEKSGYCFGFEGPPGIGKTSLAKKGIANCLKDLNNESRPFSFIAIGGASNGSILDGHNYTYVGSNWGKIVDVLIDTKCMNPIIFIDELDKVSKTEHGKEIIGILTHLVDTTQNNTFQDKYFSNIDLDLSKALFIFSYNDVEQIDRILLDRIHRIKFDSLLLPDKLIISNQYILPDLYKKFDLENIINFDDNLIEYVIINYTNEAGVRKLKEIFYEIISSINLDLLKKTNKYNIPIVLTQETIDEILKERQKIRFLSTNSYPKVGVINGLWANSFGNSGILHIESKFCDANNNLELKLTGMQGDVMKESMNVAKTLTLSLLSDNENKIIKDRFEKTNLKGIHIHVPEGATPKDGPSAGTAITLVLYSLLTNKKIKNNIAITGEICLQGNITAIGALDLKIIGGIRAGVKTFLYPKENAKDFSIFYEKYRYNLDGYDFFEVTNINEAIKYAIL